MPKAFAMMDATFSPTARAVEYVFDPTLLGQIERSIKSEISLVDLFSQNDQGASIDAYLKNENSPAIFNCSTP